MRKGIIFFMILLLLLLPKVGLDAMNGEKVELSAVDFSLTLEEAKMLDAEMAKDENHAKVSLLNQVTKEYAIPFVTVDTNELEAINNAVELGVYPLTFRINHNDYQDEKTVMVTIMANDVEDIVVISAPIVQENDKDFSKAIIMDIFKLILGIAVIGLGVFFVRKKAR